MSEGDGSVEVCIEVMSGALEQELSLLLVPMGKNWGVGKGGGGGGGGGGNSNC